MPNAKRIGWAIYAAGFGIWLFGYVSAGHAPAFDWGVATPWWISSFVRTLEAELGLASMFASMVPIYWRPGGSARRAVRASSRSGLSTRLLGWWQRRQKSYDEGLPTQKWRIIKLSLALSMCHPQLGSPTHAPGALDRRKHGSCGGGIPALVE